MNKVDMFWFLKDRAYSRSHVLQFFAKPSPIGVDIGDDSIQVAQLENNGKGLSLIAGGSKNCPADVEAGSANWQSWASEAMQEVICDGQFRGRDVIAAIPATEVFIEHVKMPKAEKKDDGQWADAILSKIKHKLPVEPDEAMIKYVSTEEDNVLVMAAERRIIDRHLAIYENANLQIKSIAVWPAALANSYTRFFGRRKTDIEAIVMLVDIKQDSTDVVICRSKTLLFARSISTGAKQLDDEEKVTELVSELTGCRRHFGAIHRKAQIERMIFLSGRTVARDICESIAKQLEMPAQMGDCLAAVEIADACGSGIDRRGCQVSWATAFGLSLSQG